MKLKLLSPVLGVDDSPLVEDGVYFLVRTALVRAVLSDVDATGQPVKGEEKIKRYDLYLKLKKADEETDFEVEEVASLRQAVLVFSTLVAGQLRAILK